MEEVIYEVLREWWRPQEGGRDWGCLLRWVAGGGCGGGGGGSGMCAIPTVIIEKWLDFKFYQKKIIFSLKSKF
jgi:hypothetical protein